MTTRGWAAALWLRAYPRSVREAHGPEIEAALAERWRESGGVMRKARLISELTADCIAIRRAERRRVRGPVTARAGAWRGATGLFADARSAGRFFTRAPLLAFGAVLTMALGIGATSAIVSLADATILRPLPIHDAGDVWELDGGWSHPDFRDFERAAPFTDLAAWSDRTLVLSRGTLVSELRAAVVSGRYFALAGLQPAFGRLLTDIDDRPGAPAVAAIGERAWTRLTGRDPTLVGSTVRLNGCPVTIVGIVPRNFRGFALSESPDVFLPIHSLSLVGTDIFASPSTLASRDFAWLRVAGRLRPGTTPSRAAADLESMYRRVHPPSSGKPLDPLTIGPIAERAFDGGGEGTSRRFVFVLIGATTVTLLLACATVASLLLVRAERRRREMSLRMALGASRARLMRLVVAESLAIGTVGSFGGLVVAWATIDLLRTFALPGGVSIADLDLSLSWTLFATAAALGFCTSTIFGLVPAWRAAGVNASLRLRDGSRGSTRHPVRSVLVGVQVALCLLLLLGSVAFGRAMRYALALDLGFDTGHTLLVAFNPAGARYSRARTLEAERRIEAQLAIEPWVASEGWVTTAPLGGSLSWEIAPPGSGDATPGVSIDANFVSNGYFAAMGIPVRAGRAFSRDDTATSPRVIVVSESMAKRFWPTGGALGTRIRTGTGSRDEPEGMATVIGIVGDTRRGIDEPADEMFYLSVEQDISEFDFGQFGHHLVVRARVPAGVAARQLAAVLAQVEPDLPATAPQTMSDHLGALLMPQRLGLTLFLLFASLAAVLTALGIYAVVAFAVSQRTREIGIRVALGAERGAVLRLVVRQGVTPVVLGAVIGAAAFVLAGSALRSLIFALPTVTFASVALVAGAIALLALAAIVVPARRALSVEPTVALRVE